MKKTLAFLTSTLLLICCGSKTIPELPPPPIPGQGELPGPDKPDEPDKPDNPVHDPVVPGSDWKAVTISEGLIYYSYEKKDEVSSAMQIVNVVDVDLNNPRYSFKFYRCSPSIVTSELFRIKDAVAAMNAGYEAGSIYIKVDGSTYSSIPNTTIKGTDVPNWKTECAIFGDGERQVDIEFTGKGGKTVADNRMAYFNDKRPNLICSAPMLIDNYEPVGETFVRTLSTSEISKLDYEHPDRHQGVRHPRTAVAKTAQNHLLMIVVDGRRTGVCEGMTAKELTRFIAKHFDPQYAINMDGGGSTTLCVKGQGDPETHVVNYPTDNNQFDHTGERARDTMFYLLDSGEQSSKPLRLCTYNVGAFNKTEASSISVVAAMIKEIGADVISLNEVDNRTTRSGNVDQLTTLCSQLGGWTGNFAKAIDYQGGGYGIAVAASPEFKVKAKYTLALDKEDGSEQRALSVIEFEDFVFASTHLDHKSASAQLHQSQTITSWMKTKFGSSSKPVFMCGDFNALPTSETITSFQQDWTLLSPAEFTFNSAAPTKCIDYIFMLKNSAKVTVAGKAVCKSLKSGNVGEVSDHLPVYVDVIL